MTRWKISCRTAASLTLAAILTWGCNSDTTQEAAEAGDEIAAPDPSAGEGAKEKEPGLLERAGLKEPPKPKPLVVPAGTRLRVRTTSALSTKTNTTGESFVATIAEPVTIDGKTAIPEGARAVGVVSLADKGGRVKGVAQIGAQLTEIDGKAVETKSYVVEANKTHKKDALKIGIGAGVGAAIGAIAGGGDGAAKGAGAGAGAGTGAVLATRGEPAVIPAESLVWFELESPLTVTP